MRSFGKWLGRFLLLALIVVGIFHLAPRETIALRGSAMAFSDPVAALAAREADAVDLVPGTEARVQWALAEGDRTDWVVVYLHGFSASSEEIRPVPDRVAEALGANLVFARLTGHGQTGAHLGAARAEDWVADTALILEVARAVGDRVLVMGTSTGGTLAAYAAAAPELWAEVAAAVFLSPNFALANPAGVLLEWPFARVWAPWIMGAERSFEVRNEAHGRYWTASYPSVAAVSLGTLMRETRNRDVSRAETPALFLFSEDDQVISADAVRAFAARWGGPVHLAPQVLPEEGADSYRHVIAGDILSPAMTEPVTRQILDWVAVAAP